eukprot:COSAG05_NODE_3447_length_2057_cov_1.024004_2_plen_326_part_00
MPVYRLCACPAPASRRTHTTGYLLKMAKNAQPFICGGTSACFSSCVIHPMDLAKTRLQLVTMQNPGAKEGLSSIFTGIIKNEGVGGLYAGLSASLLRQASYGSARIGLFGFISTKVQESWGGGSLPFIVKTGVGMVAGALAVIVGTPCDVALVRMQADTMAPVEARRNYKGVFDALKRIAAEEGAGSLWTGLAPNVGRGMAMTAGQLAVYDEAKEALLKVTGDDPKHPGGVTRAGASASGAICCAYASLPFDMIKSRLQNQKAGADGKMPYAGVVDCFMKVVGEEGVLALWTGHIAYAGRCVPHAMILLLVREPITDAYKNVFGL